MARDTITKIELSYNAAVTIGTGTTITPSNGAQLEVDESDHTLIRVTNTDSSAHTVTIPTGVNVFSPYGDYTVSIPASGDYVICIESGKYLQADGYVYINFATGHTGKIYAIELP